MAKRIKIFMPNGNESIEIWDNQLDNFLAKGYKSEVEKKPTTIKPKVVEIKKEETKEQ
jgi:hypothetical protein